MQGNLVNVGEDEIGCVAGNVGGVSISTKIAPDLNTAVKTATGNSQTCYFTSIRVEVHRATVTEILYFRPNTADVTYVVT